MVRVSFLLVISVFLCLIFTSCTKLRGTYVRAYVYTEEIFSLPRYTIDQVNSNSVKQPITLVGDISILEIKDSLQALNIEVDQIDTILTESITISLYEDSITNHMNYFTHISVEYSDAITNTTSQYFSYKYTPSSPREATTAYLKKTQEINHTAKIHPENIQLMYSFYINGASNEIGFAKNVKYKLTIVMYVSGYLFRGQPNTSIF